MHRFASKIRSNRLAACTAMAAALVTVGVGQSASVDAISSPASAASSETRIEKQIEAAERAVKKARDNAQARTALAQAYLSAGRFESAATTFEDAVTLGDSSPRTALGMALAYTGAGRSNEAVTVLNQWRESLPATDLGLALALAGQTGQGVQVLSDALRGGENTPKLRQNLAYAYALDGRWSEARLMASQDVSADQLDARISQWALQGKPEDYNVRVASLLGAPVRSDPGQPIAIALNSGSGVATKSAELATLAPPAASASSPTASGGELPAVNTGETFWGSTAPEPAAPQQAVIEQPVVQPVAPAPAPVLASAEAPAPTPYVFKPAYQAPAKPAAKPATVRTSYVAANPTHLVQLGSFSSEANANRAVKIFQSRNPRLKEHDMQITKAVVRGKTYWRVAAGGFSGGTARAMCSTVKGRGGACFAYAIRTPWPGAVPANSNLLLARR